MLQIEEECDLELLRDREQAIRKIESDIVEVNQIFKDLATMVHEQGEVIDSIEANVETASIQVHEGTQQISKARDYQVMTFTALTLTQEFFSFHCCYVLFDFILFILFS
jgi:t-SNARE complex subunit (syntaxin)